MICVRGCTVRTTPHRSRQRRRRVHILAVGFAVSNVTLTTPQRHRAKIELVVMRDASSRACPFAVTPDRVTLSLARTSPLAAGIGAALDAYAPPRFPAKY